MICLTLLIQTIHGAINQKRIDHIPDGTLVLNLMGDVEDDGGND
jgi:hypothetical protein